MLTLAGAAELAVMLFPEEVLPGAVVTVPAAGPFVTVPEAGVLVVPELVLVVTVVVVVVIVVLPLTLVLVVLVVPEDTGELMVSEDEVCAVPVVACVTEMPFTDPVHAPSLLKLYSLPSIVTVLFFTILPFSLSR